MFKFFLDIRSNVIITFNFLYQIIIAHIKKPPTLMGEKVSGNASNKDINMTIKLLRICSLSLRIYQKN